MIPLKLDENFSPNTTEIFKKAGFDTHSVIDEHLSGVSDEVIYSTCLSEKRCLITFDTDFCDILRFPAEPTEGITSFVPNVRLLYNIKMFAIKLT
jgi:predicted nuclease of predicted toxin-antitoxin system